MATSTPSWPPAFAVSCAVIIEWGLLLTTASGSFDSSKRYIFGVVLPIAILIGWRIFSQFEGLVGKSYSVSSATKECAFLGAAVAVVVSLGELAPFMRDLDTDPPALLFYQIFLAAGLGGFALGAVHGAVLYYMARRIARSF
jgi:hypothetical protein